MLIEIKCPNCSANNKFSLVGSSYYGPYRCWKCRELFTVRIEDNELKSCEPLTQEEIDRQQEELERQKEIEALKNKFKRPGQ